MSTNIKQLSKKIEKFRFWTQRVLPTVYDDSLSYYELLGKVIHYLNETTEQTNLISDEMIKVLQEFANIKEWIDSEALTENVITVLKEWYDSGFLANIINKNVFDMKVDTETFMSFMGDVEDTTNEIQSSISMLSVNVKSLGAKGDGTTNDTNAIQNAVNLVGENGGGVVFIPRGTYLTNTIYVRYPNVIIQGAGIGATVLTLVPMAIGSVIQIANYNNPLYRGTVKNSRVFDMEINGNRQNQKNGSNAADGIHIGIRVEDAVNTHIERVKVHSCDGYGIGIVGGNLPHREGLVIRDAEIFNNNYDGIDIKDGFRRALIENVESYENGGGNITSRDPTGIDIRGSHITVRNCILRGNNSHGIRIRVGSTRRVVVESCIAIDNTLDGFRLDGAANEEYLITNCQSLGNRHGISGEAGRHSLIGCVIANNREHGVSSTFPDISLMFERCSIKQNAFDGINVNGVAFLSVTNCDIHANGRHGILVRGQTRFTLQNSEVSNNGTNVQGTGLVLDGVSRNWIVSANLIINRGSGVQYRGVQFSNTSTSGVLANNVIRENTNLPVAGTIPANTINANNLT